MRPLASAVEYVRRNKMECVASFFSAMGSMLLSFNGEHAKYAWIIFLVSNAMFNNALTQSFVLLIFLGFLLSDD